MEQYNHFSNIPYATSGGYISTADKILLGRDVWGGQSFTYKLQEQQLLESKLCVTCDSFVFFVRNKNPKPTQAQNLHNLNSFSYLFIVFSLFMHVFALITPTQNLHASIYHIHEQREDSLAFGEGRGEGIRRLDSRVHSLPYQPETRPHRRDVPLEQRVVFNIPCIEDDFEPGVVIVLFSREESAPNRSQNHIFSDIQGIRHIEELTRIPERNLNSRLINFNNFRQIYTLYLECDTKEAVVSTIAELQDVPGVIFATPNRRDAATRFDMTSELTNGGTRSAGWNDDGTPNDPLFPQQWALQKS